MVAFPDLPEPVRVILEDPNPTPFNIAVARTFLDKAPPEIKELGNCALAKHAIQSMSGADSVNACQEEKKQREEARQKEEAKQREAARKAAELLAQTQAGTTTAKYEKPDRIRGPFVAGGVRQICG